MTYTAMTATSSLIIATTVTNAVQTDHQTHDWTTDRCKEWPYPYRTTGSTRTWRGWIVYTEQMDLKLSLLQTITLTVRSFHSRPCYLHWSSPTWLFFETGQQQRCQIEDLETHPFSWCVGRLRRCVNLRPRSSGAVLLCRVQLYLYHHFLFVWLVDQR